MSAGHEGASFVGGPLGGQRGPVRPGARVFEVVRPAEPLRLILSDEPPALRPLVKGEYRRVEHTSPPVFMWQGWGK